MFEDWWGQGRYGYTDETAGIVKDVARAAFYAGVTEGQLSMERVVNLQAAALNLWRVVHSKDTAMPSIKGFSYNGP